MTSNELENVVHEEFLSGALIEGTAMQMTYRVEEGKLTAYEFVAEGSCLNKKRTIKHNPVWDLLGMKLISLGLSTFVGGICELAANYSGGEKITDTPYVVGLATTLVTYLGLYPVTQQLDMENKADRNAWKKYVTMKSAGEFKLFI